MAMESSSNHMACLLKIESPTPGWRKSLRKLLETINDVNFMIDKRSKTVYVSGKTDPQIILEKITKSGKNAVIVWSNNGQNKPPENQKENLMEQCHVSPGLMNVHYGFSNYPQPGLMYYQPQPHYQHFALPPPYPRQFHPQPPPPPPYEYHESKPAAKSFPPTPPPPKNFVMGDLQFGLCTIM